MAGNGSHSVRIELLLEDNFEPRKMQAVALLTKNDLWEYVNGENQIPDIVNGTDAVANAANARLRSAWLKSDKKAKSDLILSIHPSELQHVRNCITSRDVWLKLESVFASKGPARKATLLKQLMLQKLTGGGDVRNHLNKFFDAVDKLAAMDVDVHKDFSTIMLLYSLPASYENFRCAIESRDELPSADALKVKIIEGSDVRKQTVNDDVAGAFIADQKKWKNKNKGNQNSNATTQFKWKCFSCGKKGHNPLIVQTNQTNQIRIHSSRQILRLMTCMLHFCVIKKFDVMKKSMQLRTKYLETEMAWRIHGYLIVDVQRIYVVIKTHL